MSVVNRQDVQRVTELAALQLSEAELSRLAGQLDEILQYVQQLQAVPTAGVAPTSHVLPLSNVTRPDEHRSCGIVERVLALAPASRGQLVKVPKVIE